MKTKIKKFKKISKNLKSSFDPLGSYTGLSTLSSPSNEPPAQDADDL